MKTTMELPDDLVRMVKLKAVHDGAKLKDLVADLIRKGLMADAATEPDSAQIARRKEIGRKFDSGEWQVELSGLEEGRLADDRRLKSQVHETEGKLRI